MKRRICTVAYRKEVSLWFVVLKMGAEVEYEYGFPRKSDAVKEARKLAKESKPSQLIIKGKNGRIQTEATYGTDPKRHKG